MNESGELTVPPGATLAVGDNTMVMTGPMGFEREYDEFRSDTAVKPDTRWNVTHADPGDDGIVHVHRWVMPIADRERPYVSAARSEVRHVPCDGSCGGVCGGDGYDVPVWVCTHDGTDVDPGYIPDHGPHRYLRSETWTFEVEVGPEQPTEIAGEVEVRWTDPAGRRNVATYGTMRLRATGEMTFEHGRTPTMTYAGVRVA